MLIEMIRCGLKIMIYDIAIIGGGASGMAAAVSLAEKGLSVAIAEAKPRIGQKILVTGSGRCNLTNLNITSANYRSENPEVAEKIIARYGADEVRAFFSCIGLVTRSKDNLIYPLSNKAASVVDCLRFALSKYRVSIFTGFDAADVELGGGLYRIKSREGGLIQARKVIIAAGGKAFNGTDTGLIILKKFGHSIKKTYPALVALTSEDAFLKGLKGVKFIGEIRVRRGSELLRTERGEILFTDYGISGIAVMQVSYLFSLYDDLVLELDFLPDMSLSEAEKTLEHMADFYSASSVTAEEYLSGIVDKKLGVRILKYSKGGSLADNLKSMPLKISGTKGFKNAQVCGGGALLSGFNPNTLESRHAEGLYAIGEVLDAVGDCGGYNLHWAWATALYATNV